MIIGSGILFAFVATGIFSLFIGKEPQPQEWISEENFQEPQELITIAELAQNPENFENRVVRVAGSVTHLMGGWEACAIGDENVYFVIWCFFENLPQVHVGDNITVSGVFHYNPWAMMPYTLSVQKIEMEF
jgi:hypothetical protein